ncbi:YIP1 family protein [Alteromonas aestuariivivens]|uniref:YIP1 family protein n=1 Tax=Alteromonas aestuariivivens TaxID=1938339 RepID=A0A3D8M6J0_9ALTE|nr:Yip1 family protein [Alteromonas aestuariivivens]RDV25190.1 YIP1 family protein [Alteromonas aestuariivivens]
MHTVSNPLQACKDIFLRPNGVFRALAAKDNWSWFPFIIVAVVSVLPNYAYLNTVDFDWYRDLLITAQYDQISPAEQDQIRAQLTPQSVLVFATVATVLGYIIINAIVAAYLNIVTRSDEQNVHGYMDWYGFSWWTAMPVVVNCLLALVLMMFTSNPQTSPNILTPLSAAFVFGIEMDSPYHNFAQAIRLDSFWSIYLTIVGISQWTSFSVKKAAVIAITPYALIWGLWLIVLAL